MGGRGAASSINGRYGKNNEKIYGSEYRFVWEYENIKFIKPNFGFESAPLETIPDKVRKPNGRVYIVIDKKNNPHRIGFYDDKTGKLTKSLDFSGHSHKDDNRNKLSKNHSHIGYEHKGSIAREMNAEERYYTARILRLWRQHQRGLL